MILDGNYGLMRLYATGAVNPYQKVVKVVITVAAEHKEKRMSDYIGCVMGGYLDENHKLLTRSQLNERIALKDEKIKNLEAEIEKLKAENEKLKEPLQQIMDYGYSSAKFSTPEQLVALLDEHINMVKEALNGKDVTLLEMTSKQLKAENEKLRQDNKVQDIKNDELVKRARGLLEKLKEEPC